MVLDVATVSKRHRRGWDKGKKGGRRRGRVAWKPEVRVLGIDDGPFERGDERVPLVGVVTRAASGYVESVLHREVRGDGDDATDAVINMVEGCSIRPNLVAVLLQNVTVAGFNTLDLDAVHTATGLPAVSVLRGRQDWAAMRKALQAGAVPNGAKKWQRIAASPERQVKRRKTTLVPVGLHPQEAIDLVDQCTVRGHMPEPLRLAHLIAAGWVLGESKGQ